MYAISSLLLVVAVSLIITRVATVILVASGLSRQAARFQARSAFTGAGFTTTESESVVNHPLRRKVVMTLMLLGNAGIVASASTLIIGFRGGSAANAGWRILESRDATWRRLRRLFEDARPTGSVVEELIAERRAEAARER